MRLIRFIPDDTKIPFMRFARVAYLISGLGILASIALFFTVGLNYGIDFRGGTLVEIQTPGQADIGGLRTSLSGIGLGNVEIQEFGEPNDVLIRIEEQPGGEEAQQEAVQTIRDALGPDVTYRRVEVVGPTVSDELAWQGTMAVISALVAVLIYIWFRFEWQFAIGAVLALFHDVILTIGIFCVLQLQFNLAIIAALLTIVGYSLNDTVVVYDRIRENLRKYKQKALPELIDLSINDTLSRTILTGVTTLLALLALYIFGGEVIRGFTFAMIWGVLVGTYSSIVVASPLLDLFGIKRDWSPAGSGTKAPAGQSRP